MTSEQIIEVAKIVAKYLADDLNTEEPYKSWYDFTLTPEDEQAILDLYYSKHGAYEQDWYEVAESIR